MGKRDHEIHDVVGVGFGPSNLALAIALEEHRAADPGNALTAAFFERQPEFGWHRNMLLPTATMQVAFLKDLTTFRNPVSPFGFVAFLHSEGRLPRFVNNQEFFPTRREFHRYLEWAERRLAQRPDYGCEVLSVGFEPGADPARATYLRVEMRDSAAGRTRAVRARNVVLSTGLVPRMPAGAEPDDRVWHSSEFLEKFRRTDPARLRSIAVVGAGESAAEIVKFCYDSLPEARVWAIMPSFGYTAADDTPFANEIFDPAAVDTYHFAERSQREAFWRYHSNTNYSVVDTAVIKELYQRAYDDEVEGVQRLTILNLTRVGGAKRTRTGVWLTLNGRHEDELPGQEFDAVVCATGYQAMDAGRLLGGLEPYCSRDEEGQYRVLRDYRIHTPELQCGVYLQGGTEHSHGLSSSLLSNIAVRAGEIVESLTARREPAMSR